jgi:hypothetical protein
MKMGRFIHALFYCLKHLKLSQQNTIFCCIKIKKKSNNCKITIIGLLGILFEGLGLMRSQTFDKFLS